MISGPQTVEAPYFNASSRKGSVPHLTIGAKHHLPFANMDVARSRAMFDDITQSFSESAKVQVPGNVTLPSAELQFLMANVYTRNSRRWLYS